MIDCFPLLTSYDPIVSGEGALDPLGLYSIADALAIHLVPGLRERMRHPRFLTAMAVSWAVTRGFDEERVAKDGISPPWQAFEWIAVEGFVHSAGVRSLNGLPGRRKATEAVKHSLPMCADRYLKTPSVFGFHGVYRNLAIDLDILSDAYLGENGARLLTEWEQEQGLDGFTSAGSEGAGAKLRRDLTRAVEQTLEQGAVSIHSGSVLWKFFGTHLLHTELRHNPKEGTFIYKLLTEEQSGHRRVILEFLHSQEGQQVWQEGYDEAAFHDALRKTASTSLGQLLDTIALYERFSRRLTDAFYEILFLLSQPNRPIKSPPASVSQDRFVGMAIRNIPDLFTKTADALSAYKELGTRFVEVFRAVSEPASALSFVGNLVTHHERIQRQKPPNGKQPWLLRYDNGELTVRPAYRQEKLPVDGLRYVHQFRTNSLWSFLGDMGFVEANHEQENED